MLARLFNRLPVGVSKPDADLTAGGAPRAAPGLFRRRPPARRIKVFVKMDTDQFDEVRTRALRNGTSVAEQIRLLIEWGLEAAQAEEDS